jgi:hypothetical protein
LKVHSCTSNCSIYFHAGTRALLRHGFSHPSPQVFRTALTVSSPHAAPVPSATPPQGSPPPPTLASHVRSSSCLHDSNATPAQTREHHILATVAEEGLLKKQYHCRARHHLPPSCESHMQGIGNSFSITEVVQLKKLRIWLHLDLQLWVSLIFSVRGRFTCKWRGNSSSGTSRRSPHSGTKSRPARSVLVNSQRRSLDLPCSVVPFSTACTSPTSAHAASSPARRSSFDHWGRGKAAAPGKSADKRRRKNRCGDPWPCICARASRRAWCSPPEWRTAIRSKTSAPSSVALGTQYCRYPSPNYSQLIQISMNPRPENWLTAFGCGLTSPAGQASAAHSGTIQQSRQSNESCSAEGMSICILKRMTC